MFAAELYPVTTADREKLKLFRNAQGSSNWDIESQGTSCQQSEMKKRKTRKQIEVISKVRKWPAKYQQALTVFVYACQSEFGCVLPQRAASSKGYKADEPEKRQL